MKVAAFLLLAVSISSSMMAQTVDPLTVTLPNGKAIHFQTEEQKAKFEAARGRQSAGAQTAAIKPPPKFTSSLDAPSSSTGVVNTAAPPFTADYYLLAPQSWVGKKATLAVAYVMVRNERDRSDGLVQMTAATWNSSPTAGGDQDTGGLITILATPSAASKIAQQCGTSLQFLAGSSRVKVTMIRGQIAPFKTTRDGETETEKSYGFYVD